MASNTYASWLGISLVFGKKQALEYKNYNYSELLAFLWRKKVNVSFRKKKVKNSI